MQTISRRSIATAPESLRNLNNAFINEAAPQTRADRFPGRLAGLSVAVKDNICTENLPTTCGSRGLRDYKSPFDATVVAQLRDAGALIRGKTNLDEFGMGSHSTHSAFGAVRSIYGSFSAGGSSGGSAVAVAAGDCDAALGTDTGGSVRLPAAYNGIYGFKPSYGLISRWGVVAYANSLDTVGVLANDLKTLRLIFGELDKFDEKDPTSLPKSTRETLRSHVKRSPKKSLRFGIPSQYNTAEVTQPVRHAWATTIRYLRSQGHTVHTVSLPTTQQALSAYYILAPSEASSNLAKYDGTRYGTPAEEDGHSTALLYAASRQHGFGDEVRRRILLGSYSLSADAIDNYFIKAQKIRRLVQRDFTKSFALPNILAQDTDYLRDDEVGVDALICPTAADLPPSTESVENQSQLDAYAGDVFTVPASLAGLPALNVPVRVENSSSSSSNGVSSVGIQIITQYGDDYTALTVGSILEPLR